MEWGARVSSIADADPWPYAADSFDVVVSNQVLEHVRDHDRLFAETRRVLKDGGYAVHLFPLKHYVWEGHLLLPFVHRIGYYDLLRWYISCLSWLGLGKFRTHEREFGTTLPVFAERHADLLLHYCNYLSYRQVLALAKRHGLRPSFRYTKEFYSAEAADDARPAREDRVSPAMAAGGVARVHAAPPGVLGDAVPREAGEPIDRHDGASVARHRHRQLERRRPVAAMPGRRAGRARSVVHAGERRGGRQRVDRWIAHGLDTLPLPLTIVRNATNRGFGAACNQGAAAGRADYLLFLNPDVYVGAAPLSVPLRFLEDPANADVGVAGIQLRDASGHVARSCTRQPTPAMFWARIVGLDAIAPSLVPSWFMTDWDHASTREVDHVIGAFYVIRRRLFERLRGFDERFFVYLEDLDVSVRARASGSRVVFLADTYAEHTGGGTSDQVKASRIAYSLHSRIRYGFKHFGPATATLLAAGTLVIEPFPRLARALARGSASEARDTCVGFARLWRRLVAG